MGNYFGIIGARIYYCIFEDFSYYSKNIIEVFKVWKGGLAIHGGILVGGITLILYCKNIKYQFIECLIFVHHIYFLHRQLVDGVISLMVKFTGQ